MKITLIGFFILIIPLTNLYSQNLIPNPSFDEYIKYMDSNGNRVYQPKDWFYIESSFSHPIYFSTDRYLEKSDKYNLHPDSAMINKGLIANYISILLLPKPQRAYTVLREPLLKGENYKISIDIRAFAQSSFFSDLLIGFTNKNDKDMDSILYQLRLEIPDSVCNATLFDTWITLGSTFVATGEEKVLIITSGKAIDYLHIIDSNRDKYYIQFSQYHPNIKYFIDNVCLEEESKMNEVLVSEAIDTLEVGESVVLSNIYFDFDKYEILDKSAPLLDSIYHYLKEKDSLKIMITGHTDNFGSDEYNDNLSALRAKAVVDYLTSKGISSDRLKAKGLGSRNPITSNDSSIGRQKNRRIEIQILSR